MMKKRNIALVIIGAAMIAALLCICLFVRPKALGSMKHSYTESTTGSSDFLFLGNAGERIKFSFASDVTGGSLDIVLCDSEGNILYQLDSARELQTFYNLESTDTYTVTAQYKDFIGSFKITVYLAD